MRWWAAAAYTGTYGPWAHAPRGSARSLTFGAGPHFCMGANLARAELQEGLAFLAQHLEGLQLDGEPEYGTITGLYGLESLPIRFLESTS